MAHRNFVTYYYKRNKEVKVNRAQHSTSCIPRAVHHMMHYDYDATSVEIVDERTGRLIARLQYTPRGIAVMVK